MQGIMGQQCGRQQSAWKVAQLHLEVLGDWELAQAAAAVKGARLLLKMIRANGLQTEVQNVLLESAV